MSKYVIGLEPNAISNFLNSGETFVKNNAFGIDNEYDWKANFAVARLLSAITKSSPVNSEATVVKNGENITLSKGNSALLIATLTKDNDIVFEQVSNGSVNANIINADKALGLISDALTIPLTTSNLNLLSDSHIRLQDPDNDGSIYSEDTNTIADDQISTSSEEVDNTEILVNIIDENNILSNASVHNMDVLNQTPSISDLLQSLSQNKNPDCSFLGNLFKDTTDDQITGLSVLRDTANDSFDISNEATKTTLSFYDNGNIEFFDLANPTDQHLTSSTSIPQSIASLLEGVNNGNNNFSQSLADQFLTNHTSRTTVPLYTSTLQNNTNNSNNTSTLPPPPVVTTTTTSTFTNNSSINLNAFNSSSSSANLPIHSYVIPAVEGLLHVANNSNNTFTPPLLPPFLQSQNTVSNKEIFSYLVSIENVFLSSLEEEYNRNPELLNSLSMRVGQSSKGDNLYILSIPQASNSNIIEEVEVNYEEGTVLLNTISQNSGNVVSTPLTDKNTMARLLKSCLASQTILPTIVEVLEEEWEKKANSFTNNTPVSNYSLPTLNQSVNPQTTKQNQILDKVIQESNSQSSRFPAALEVVLSGLPQNLVVANIPKIKGLEFTTPDGALDIYHESSAKYITIPNNPSLPIKLTQITQYPNESNNQVLLTEDIPFTASSMEPFAKAFSTVKGYTNYLDDASKKHGYIPTSTEATNITASEMFDEIKEGKSSKIPSTVVSNASATALLYYKSVDVVVSSNNTTSNANNSATPAWRKLEQNKDRHNNRKVIDGVYASGDDIDNTLRDIIIATALKIDLPQNHKIPDGSSAQNEKIQKALKTIELARESGAVSSKDGVTEDPWEKEFSKKFQMNCKKCGILSGRGTSSVGLRTAYIPDAALKGIDGDVITNASQNMENKHTKAKSAAQDMVR